tara:strand:- start:1304 stop:1525 length:222 start_codon:yes stop_codon:yes gene_type:complete
LPERWRAADFAAEGKRRGVIIAPAEVFAAGRVDVPHAVHICIDMPRYRNQLQSALDTLANILMVNAYSDVAMV